MMVADAEIVRDRESRIRRYVADLRDLSQIAEGAFVKNRERQYAVLHALQLAIEASVEIATHICAADRLGTPSSIRSFRTASAISIAISLPSSATSRVSLDAHAERRNS
jgi:hypothetical protein